MEYKPLCRERDEIRVISIQPSVYYSGGRRNFNSWASTLSEGDKAYPCLPAVRISVADDLVHCTLETVSLQDKISKSNKSSASSQSALMELPAWRLQRDFSDVCTGAQARNLAEKIAPRLKWGDFEALSYTWGQDNSDGRVIVDGKLCLVHKNLEAALRRLRALPETKFGMKYWIDALCINQGDTDERHVEVKRMSTLYKTAWKVVVWLGEESVDSNQACDCISAVSHLPALLFRKNPAHTVEEIFGDLNWEPLRNVLGRSYWNRVWIIQELAMNYDNPLFICGNRAFFRKELTKLLFLFGRPENLMIKKFLNTMPGSLAVVDQMNLCGLSQRVLDLLRLDCRASPGWSFQDVIDLAQEESAKDTRDKIYGIHGLLPTDLSARIQPRYDLPIKDVFQDFSENLLMVFGLESLLLLVASGGPDLALPSWCIDLSSLEVIPWATRGISEWTISWATQETVE